MTLSAAGQDKSCDGMSPTPTASETTEAGLPAGIGEWRGKIKLDFTEIKKDGFQDTIRFV